jgi:hypothetical protein
MKRRFKINDYVKVVEGFIPDDMEESVRWQGKIVELVEEDCYLMEFDAETLDTLTDEYLKSCVEEGDDALSYFLLDEDLEAAERRDNDALFVIAKQKVLKRMENMVMDDYEESYESNSKLLKEWEDAFLKSPEYLHFPEEGKMYAEDAPSTFGDFAYNYEGTKTGKWKEGDVVEVCLGWVPRKVSAEVEFFHYFGWGLVAFFRFLERENLMHGAGKLAKRAAEIAPEIPKRASDSGNWGMAKSLFMSASALGFDPNKEEDLKAYINLHYAGLIENKQWPGSGFRHDPFSNYTGGSLVKVKYEDGTVVKCKFSKVEKDLRSGICAIVKNK